MKSAVFIAITFALVALPTASHAQSGQSLSAEVEAVRRQAAVQETRFKMQRAQDQIRQGNLADAGKTYNEALKLAQSAGGNAETETKQIINDLISLNLQLGEMAYRRGDVVEAETRLGQVLKLDPRNQAAIDLKARHAIEVARTEGKVPSAEAKSRVPAITAERLQAATLVQDGKLLYELRKLDEAEKKFKQAFGIDPSNEAASYYLNLIRQARYSIEASKREVGATEALLTVERKWFEPLPGAQLAQPNVMARTNQIHTSNGRQAIFQKMNEIIFPEVIFDGLPLSEVVKYLSDEAKKQDPKKLGLNFIINSLLSDSGGAPTIDPTTGAAVPGLPGDAVDLNIVTIKINPPLARLTLAQVLDAITKSADKPIKFSVEDYAIVFTPRRADLAQIFTRYYRVDPNTFLQGLENVSGTEFGALDSGGGGGGGGGRGGGGRGGGGGGGQGGGAEGFIIPRVQVAESSGGQGGQGGRGGQGGGQQGGAGITGVTITNRQENIQQLAKVFFTANGINVNPPNAIFWNDRSGKLMVRATMQELDLVEQAIQVLNEAPPQVMIEAKFAEVAQTDNKGLGFDWYLGNYKMGAVGAQAGTAPSLNGNTVNGIPQTFPGAPAVANGLIPGAFGQNTLLPAANSTLIPRNGITDQLLTGGLRNEVGKGNELPAVATLTGILTDPQFRMVVRALEQRSGVDLLSAPRVTTLSGRQTQIAVVDVLTVVAGVQAGNQNQNQNQNVAAGGFTQQNNANANINYDTQPLPFGPVLDVIPYVSADGYTIQMTIIPTLTEFIGYDTDTAALFVPQVQIGVGSSIGTPVAARLPLPILRSRQLVTSCTVWDGQTVMLGGLIAESVSKIKDKVPVLGDIPLVGRFFRSESRSSSKKNLVIFVTPTIIDPAGNRVHTDAELPYSDPAKVLPTF